MDKLKKIKSLFKKKSNTSKQKPKTPIKKQPKTPIKKQPTPPPIKQPTPPPVKPPLSPNTKKRLKRIIPNKNKKRKKRPNKKDQKSMSPETYRKIVSLDKYTPKLLSIKPITLPSPKQQLTSDEFDIIDIPIKEPEYQYIEKLVRIGRKTQIIKLKIPK